MGYQITNSGSKSTLSQTNVHTSSKHSTIRQWTAGIIASMGMWSVGSTLGWSSPTAPQLENGDGIEALNENQVLLTALLGCFVGGYLSERIGRRIIFICGALPFICGWAIVAAGQKASMIILGRAITGLAAGTYMTVVAVFCAEISEDTLRSKIASFTMVAACVGILYSFAIGALVHWRINTVICGATPAVVLVGMLYLPETPRFLVAKGYIEKASKSLQWYRGTRAINEVENELEKIIKDVGKDRSNLEAEEKLFVAHNLKPVLISLASTSLQQLCGTTAVTFYTVDIFDATGTDIHPNISAIIYGVTQAVATAFAGILMTKFGRRPLFLFSEIGMSLSLGVLGVFYYLKEYEPEIAKNLGWLPLLSLMAFTITYCCGAGILPLAIIADLCPPQVKGPAAAVCFASSF